MNDTIYNDVLIPYIPHRYRQICNMKDWWLIPIKRIHRDMGFCALLTDIILHAGSPCVYRYCICTYFSDEDKAHYVRSYSEFYLDSASSSEEGDSNDVI